MKPDHAKNIDFVGQCDQGEYGGGLQVMVNKGFAYVGHTGRCGVNIIDVRNPKQPKLSNFLPAMPGCSSPHLQTHGDLLLTANRPPGRNPVRDFSNPCGVQVCDISKPGAPRPIGFLQTDGLGCHRLWYDGGRYAYGSIHWDGFSNHILGIIDLADPTKPELVGQWWLPGMNQAAGEVPGWKSRRVGLHHALVAGDLAYCAWRDECLVILDISNKTAPNLVRHMTWRPSSPGSTHTPLPLPDRNLLVIGDEATAENCTEGVPRNWLFDVRAPSDPVSIATMPVPAEQDYCAKGGKFGMHNFHENRTDSLQNSSLIFCAYQNAGVRVWDISDAFHPKESGAFVPPLVRANAAGQKPALGVNDVYVMPDGLMFVSELNHGLMVLQYRG
jgi:hypothetical protein